MNMGVTEIRTAKRVVVAAGFACLGSRRGRREGTSDEATKPQEDPKPRYALHESTCKRPPRSARPKGVR